ncbi:chloride channel protein [Flavobacterium granuli]|uniref:CIC family chloride channel protein n=1 Tax=Flavobacterium granuli TaxID=280093 RepID=A0A1M5LK49_9FLAO|nr:chloride channel protein [Flavobacterium granuli]PRZ24007.1 CIC family chloride channel protein [Flavobacterium granuli]SHG65280.1 chloride channel protein, CIC family [Flavobacterium granuli]
MNNTSRIKKNYQFIKFQKLVIVSVLIGFLSAFLGVALKKITEYYEEIFFHKATVNPLFFVIFPIFGLSVIYFLREYLFRKKENKGIKEIFESTNSKSKNLPNYKIPSHFINGLLTVIFGGSTGIEVSTVVASATIGSVAQRKQNVFKQYKTELICAGIAAGITALFSSPVAGIFFALEVISRKVTRAFLISNLIAVTVAFGLISLLDEKPLFALTITTWHLKAIPYFILLGILAGLNSVYLTRCVLFFKSQFSKIETHYYKIIIGSVILTVSLLLFPQLYGEGYHALKTLFNPTNEIPLTLSLALTYVGIIVLKPIVTSATLASGGDGGVFAPSLFIGAFLGLLVASTLNTFFNVNVIPLNFMVIGMAAVLSASIHAPFTAIFLVCGLTNDYTLFLPILMVCLISKYTAKIIYPYNVYTYTPSLTK